MPANKAKLSYTHFQWNTEQLSDDFWDWVDIQKAGKSRLCFNLCVTWNAPK